MAAGDDGQPRPDLSARERYRRSLLEDRPELPWCPTCGAWVVPPRSRCGQCGGVSLQWRRLSRRGVVGAWTVVHRAPHEGMGTPYGLVLVDLHEGPRLLARAEGAAPWLAVGLEVQLHVAETVLGRCLAATPAATNAS